MTRPSSLSVTEQDVYLRLLSGACTVEELATTIGCPRRTIAAILNRLVDSGLAMMVGLDDTVFAAVPPDVAVAAVALERQRVEAVSRLVVARLEQSYRRTLIPEPDAAAEVLLGEKDCRAAFAAVLSGARRAVRICESAYAMREGRPAYPEVRAQLARGVTFRVLYDRRGFDRPARIDELGQEMSAGEVARIIEVPFKMVLTDEPVGWLALDVPAYGNFARLRVRDPSILEALGAMFETLWELGMPLPTVSRDADAQDDKDATATLAWLLAAGLSERAIADYLGCHERTARRRVHDLMARLDANTPFQAGYQLARRGFRPEPTVTVNRG